MAETQNKAKTPTLNVATESGKKNGVWLFARLCDTTMMVFLFLATFITTIIYPLSLPQEWITAFRQTEIANLLGFSYWMSYFTMDHSITVLKDYAFVALLLPLPIILLIRHLVCGTPSTHNTPIIQRLANPYFWFIIIWIYAIMRCFPQTSGLPKWLTSPTPQGGMRNLIFMTVGFMALVSIYHLRAHWKRMVTIFMNVSCVIGAGLALISLAQHLGLTQSFLIAAADPRNRIGSLIGHNVGVSTWLMFPLSFAIYMVLRQNSSIIRKTLCWALILLICWVLVAAQSRSVWLLFLGLVPFYLYFQIHGVNLPKDLRLRIGLLILLIILAVIATQTVRPSVNPLAGRHETSLSERIRRLSIKELQTETRIRIVLCSISLLQEKPIIGHGLGSFQYVYQPAQGSWLNRNRDSFVVGTWKRTDVAHNDPLQLLIEMGLIGAVLALIPLTLLTRRGLRYQSKTKNEDLDEAAIRRALFLPVLVIIGQSFVDFPFHLPSLASIWLLCFGLWTVSNKETDTTQSAAGITTAQTKVLPYRIAVAVCLCCAAYAVSYSYRFITRELISDKYFTMASKQFGQAQATPDNLVDAKNERLQLSRTLYRNAIHADIFSGKSYEGAALADIETARIIENMLEANPNIKDASLLRGTATQIYEGAMDKIKQMMTFGELNYHYSHYLEGQTAIGLWRLTKNNTYLDKARNYYTEGIEMNPADIYSLSELFRMWELNPGANPAKSLQAKRSLFKYDARVAYNQFIEPAWISALAGKANTAQKHLTRLSLDMPEQWRIRLAQAEIMLLESMWPPIQSAEAQTTTGLSQSQYAKQRLQAAESILQKIEQDVPESDEPIMLAQLHLYCTQNDLQGAFDFAVDGGKRYPSNQEFAALRYVLAQKLGLKAETPFLFKQHPELLNNIINFYDVFYFDNLYEASSKICTMAKDKSLPINSNTFVRIAEYTVANGGPEMAQTLLDWLEANEPGTDRYFRIKEILKK